MYLYNFFKSLNLLKKDNVPALMQFNVPDVIYLGCKSVNEVPREIPGIESETTTVYLYTKLQNLQLQAYDISPIEQYLNSIKQTKIDDRFHLLSVKLAEAIVYEAIWLLDVMLDIPNDKTFLTSFEAGIPQLYSLYHQNTDVEDHTSPILSLFQSPLEKDLFLTKTKYFIIQYCNCRIDALEDDDGTISVRLSDPDEENDFQDVLEKMLESYYQKPPYENWKSKLITCFDNTELDDMLQQLSVVSTHTKSPIGEL